MPWPSWSCSQSLCEVHNTPLKANPTKPPPLRNSPSCPLAKCVQEFPSMKASLRSNSIKKLEFSGSASTGLDEGLSTPRQVPVASAKRKREPRHSVSATTLELALEPRSQRSSKRFKSLDGGAVPVAEPEPRRELEQPEVKLEGQDGGTGAPESRTGLDRDLTTLSVAEIVDLLRNGDLGQKQLAANEARLLAQTESNRRSLAETGILPILVATIKSSLGNSGHEGLLRHVAGALWNLAVNVSNNREIVSLEAIPPLIQLLKHESPKIQRVAAGAIRCLGWKHDSNRTTISREGGVPPLVALASSPIFEVQEQACAALWNLGLNTSVSEIITNEGAVKVMVRLVASDVVELQRVAAGVLRCLAYMYEPNRMNIANEGGIKYLCRLLSSPSVKVQQQAAAALGNLTYRNGPNRVTVTTEGGVERLVTQLSSRSSEVQLMASTTLRNLALNEENRVAIGRAGAIPPLISLLEAPKSDLQVQVAAAIWNLSLNDQNKVILVRSGALNKLYALYRSASTDVVYYAKGALFAMGIELDRPQQ